MGKILTAIELKAALHATNARKGMPVEILTNPTGSYIQFRALRNVGSFRRQFLYMHNPYQLLRELEALPDVKPGFGWSLLGRFF